ncbi:MAG: hypothetical protein M9942_14515 [Microthrixaceae bacterium]|nr:hypothetical protein [Microthrixaceae bacterium]MCO5319635.1 hypothetical protein [Microthrixaceae bacterium]
MTDQRTSRPKKNDARDNSAGSGNRGSKKRRKKRKKKGSKESAIDRKRPLWENPTGEAELRSMVGSVRPAQHPSAVVRSLGDPPLGKFASNAHHYYDAVYEKAQQFAVAIATANGLLMVDDGDDAGAGAEASGEDTGS